nr:reverse transcriptase domain-containing protein [Tanacetum cinerariifolium]
MIQQVQNSFQFHGLPGDDANKHLDKLLTRTQSMKQNGVPDDSLCLFLFPYYLTHHATAWFDRLPNNSIHTFKVMVSKFLSKYFPPSMVTKLRNDIRNFRQLPDESLFEAWERYKLLIDCPNHKMLPVTQIDTFYNGLTFRHRDTINVAAGGTFMKRRLEECYDLIKNMTAHHNDWDTSAQRGESSRSITSSSPEIAALTQQITKMIKIFPRMCQSNQQVNMVNSSYETYGGPYHYYKSQAVIPPPNPPSSKEVERDPELTMDQMFKKLHFNISFAEALAHMPKYAKMLKDLLSNKEKLLKLANTPLNKNCSAVLLKKLPEKLEDPGKFLIPCDFIKLEECMALADLGISFGLDVGAGWIIRDGTRAVLFELEMCTWSMVSSGSLSTSLEEGGLGGGTNQSNTNPCGNYFNIFLRVRNGVDRKRTLSPTPSFDLVVASLSPSLTLFGDSDFLLEESVVFLTLDDSIPPKIDSGIIDKDEFKPSVQHQRSVNPKNHEVINAEVIKLLDAGLIYPISDSPWEKCHFMVKEGLVLGHKIAKNGIEVDHAKVNVIAKLTHPSMVKGIRSFIEFNIKIRDKKGAANLANNHLSRLENPHEGDLVEMEITDNFPHESLNMIYLNDETEPPWFTDISNYLVGRKLWIFLKLVTMVPPKDITTLITPPRNFSILVSFGPLYIVMPMTWSNTMTHANVKEKSHKGTKCPRILSRFVRSLTYGHRLYGAVPVFTREQVLEKYDVTHNLSTSFHPQTSGQMEVSNHGLKRVLERTVGEHRAK